MGTTTTLPIEQNGRRPIERAGLEAAIEQAGEAIVITDTRGSIQYVNPAFTRMTGYSQGRSHRTEPQDPQVRTNPPQLYEELWATIRRGGTWHGELVNRRKDGSLYTEEMNIAPVRAANGETVSFIAIKEDVTGRRAAEEAQRFLASIVETSEDGIIGYTRAGIIRTFNRGAELISGYSAEEVIGKHFAILLAPSELPAVAGVDGNRAGRQNHLPVQNRCLAEGRGYGPRIGDGESDSERRRRSDCSLHRGARYVGAQV